MDQNKARALVAVFEDRRRAEEALEELRHTGFRDDRLGLAAQEGPTPAEQLVDHEDATVSRAGAVGGALAGGAVGSLAGLALAAGLIPGIGPVIAGGMLVSVLAGTATGAVAGGLGGALAGLGIPDEESRYYEDQLQAGRTLVTVRAGDDYNLAYNILRRHGAYGLGSPDPVADTRR